MSLKEDLLEAITSELILNSAPVYMLDQIELEKKEKFLRDINFDSDSSIKIKTKDFDSPFTDKNQIPFPEEIEEETPMPGIVKSNGMEKIIPLLEDELVTEIECLGPEKFLIIHKSFNTIPLKLSLDKYEIESILNFFSREARIPRIGGIFKAIINNLIINAIDSEFGGPRFIVSKIHSTESDYL